MAEALDENTIERLMRALFATLAPITGGRGTGFVTATAGDAAVLVPANTYLLPVVRGELRDDLPFKTVGAALVPANTTLAIGITSNVGGARHNMPEGTTFRFSPPVAGLSLTATLEDAITNASNTGALLKSLAIFEDVDADNAERDFFAANIGEYPAAILAWQQSEPTEGTTAGLRKGASRGGRQVAFYRENFVLYIIVNRLNGPGFRRQEGLLVMQAAARLLSDRMQNDDGEQLSAVGGGVEIVDRARLARAPTRYLYAIRLRANQTSEGGAYSSRTFNRWQATRITGAAPGRVAPEPTEPLVIVDDTEPMP